MLVGTCEHVLVSVCWWARFYFIACWACAARVRGRQSAPGLFARLSCAWAWSFLCLRCNECINSYAFWSLLYEAAAKGRFRIRGGHEGPFSATKGTRGERDKKVVAVSTPALAHCHV